MNQELCDKCQQAADLISRSKHAVVLTGAGISTPSGIPDFRSPGTGLWTKTDPMKVATLSVFRNNPEEFYRHWIPGLRQMLDAVPNPAHTALAEMEQKGFLKAVITQNIDGLHQRAGSRNVYEVHGTMMTFSCLKCRTSVPADEMIDNLLDAELLPRCSRCNSILKPDIVLFEEMLPQDVWAGAEFFSRQADVFLVVGSSLEVIPAAYLPHYALSNHAKLVINNFMPTHLDGDAEVLLPGNVAEVLPQVAGLLSS